MSVAPLKIEAVQVPEKYWGEAWSKAEPDCEFPTGYKFYTKIPSLFPADMKASWPLAVQLSISEQWPRSYYRRAVFCLRNVIRAGRLAAAKALIGRLSVIANVDISYSSSVTFKTWSTLEHNITLK